MIKAPVRYDAVLQAIFETSDSEAPLAVIEAPWATDEQCNVIGNQIASALNTAADQSRVIEVMQKALENYRFTCERGYCGHAHRDELPKCHVEGCECASLDNRAANALAEAKRIMEGNNEIR